MNFLSMQALESDWDTQASTLPDFGAISDISSLQSQTSQRRAPHHQNRYPRLTHTLGLGSLLVSACGAPPS